MVSSLVKFEDLDMSALTRPAFNWAFEAAFKNQMAVAARVHADNVQIHSVVPGSVQVYIYYIYIIICILHTVYI